MPTAYSTSRLDQEPVWEPSPDTAEKPLELPVNYDSLESLASKMTPLAEVVLSGYSLALSTGLKATQYRTTDPAQLAMPRMTPIELREYQAWVKDPSLPEWNKETCKLNRENWQLGGDAKLEEWTDAVRLMFNDPSIQRESTIYLYTEMKFLIPIITAHIKVRTAIRQLTVNGADLTPNQFAEYITAKKISSVAATVVQKSAKARALTRYIAAANEVIRKRLNLYKEKLQPPAAAAKSSTKANNQKKIENTTPSVPSPEGGLPLTTGETDSNDCARQFLDKLEDFLKHSASPYIAPSHANRPLTSPDDINALRKELAPQPMEEVAIREKRPFSSHPEALYDAKAGKKRAIGEEQELRKSNDPA
ncbi:hypothetical protein KEM55_004238 [Ascosphaera atra]|nr:hypothetical protein KEM55_004238 [Ascosphaera atra]